MAPKGSSRSSPSGRRASVADRRWLIVAVLVMLAGFVAFVQLGAGGGGDREDLAGYRVVYDVRVHLPTGEESSRREVTVRRPFAGSDLTFADDEDRPQSGTIADGRNVYTIRQDTAFDSGEAPPGSPPGDYRFAPVLDDLVRLDLLDERGDDRIAERDCTVYRSGAPLGDPLRAPSEAEYVDWCIDGDGLLLRERWFLDGKLLRETTAISVETTTPGPDAFDVDLPTAPSPTGTSTCEELAIDERPDVGELPYYVAVGDTSGLALESRWRSVTISSVTGVPQVQDIVFVDVYRRGTDVVLVAHREQAIAGEQPDGYDEVGAGPLGEGQVFLSERGAELRFDVDPWVVSVRGTLSVADLAEFASALAPTGP